MELDRKFQMAMTCGSVTIGSLHPDRQYFIVHAERVYKRYGQSVLFVILDSPTTTVKMFLSKCYYDVVSEEDIEDINSKRVLLYRIYKETCVKSKSYIL